jgi:chromosome segregation ATPase
LLNSGWSVVGGALIEVGAAGAIKEGEMMGKEQLPPEVPTWRQEFNACANCESLESRVRELETERDRLKEENGNMDSMYQDRMLALYANLHKHYEQLRARHAALVEAAEKSNKTFYKMLHHFDGNLDYPKEYRKYIDQLSSELKAALAEVK